MVLSSINLPAVFAAGISSFIVGGMWYSKRIFGKAWMAESKLTEEKIKQRNKGKLFGFTALFSILMAFTLAVFLTDAMWDAKIGVIEGVMAGVIAGIWTFCAIAIHSLFELKSWRYIFINGCYSVISLILMGAIIGWWR